MNRNSWAASMAIVAVLIVSILGFRFLGSPSTQRDFQKDLRRIQALSTLAQQIDVAWNQSEKTLPANLDRITFATKNDPFTGRPYQYHLKQNGRYELCATFSSDSRQSAQANTADFWLHPKGDYCFMLDATQSVPPIPYYDYY